MEEDRRVRLWNSAIGAVLHPQEGGDHLPNDLRRSGRDGECPRVAIEAACPMIVHVAEAAMNLETLRDDLLRRRVAEEFDHADLAGPGLSRDPMRKSKVIE